jgi:hypothetical protein
MSQPRLEVNIAPHGAVEIEAIDCTGEQCVEASAPIEVVLGGVSAREDKPERFDTPAATTENAIKRSF